MNPPPKITEGLIQVLDRYCSYRGWQSVSAETVVAIRALIEKASTIEECLAGLEYFFESSAADVYVIERRPNLPVSFIIACWERYEFFAGEAADFVRREPPPFNEYSVVRGYEHH